MKTLVFSFLLLCSVAFSAEYTVIHDGRTGKVQCIQRTKDGACIPLSTDNRDYKEFLVWNETAKIVVADRAPDPIPPAEIERQRKLALAITYVKNVPEVWENGTNDQKVIWAMKQILRDIKGQLNEE